MGQFTQPPDHSIGQWRGQWPPPLDCPQKRPESRNEPEMFFKINQPLAGSGGRLPQGDCWLPGDDISAAHEEQLSALAPVREICLPEARGPLPLGYALLASPPPLPPFFRQNEPNLSFRINKTVQKRTQNEPKRTQNEPNFRGYSAQANTPTRKNRATRGTNLRCPSESINARDYDGWRPANAMRPAARFEASQLSERLRVRTYGWHKVNEFERGGFWCHLRRQRMSASPSFPRRRESK